MYSTPVHAWNELFFILCVSKYGRFIWADDCTVDKARLDFACIFISTPLLEVVNTSTDILVDDNNYTLQLVEE